MAFSNLPHLEVLAKRASKDAEPSSRMTYAEFWPRYLKAHADPRTRALHYLGSGAGLVLLVVFAATRNWRYLIAAPIIGYACAWLGHGVFEHNRPQTFGHPLWSLYSDFRMLALFFAGRLSAELRRVSSN